MTGPVVAHSVGFAQYLLGDLLRVKIPRARCGVLLTSAPDDPQPDEFSPACPRCAAAGGNRKP